MNARNTLAIALTVAAATVVAAPQAQAVNLIGLSSNNTLLRFDSANPGATDIIQVTGVDGNLLGIDRRPANNLVYGLTSTNKLYTINPITGAASFVSTLSVPFTSGIISGVDFNPVPDRLRVVGGNGQNFRINVDTGAVSVDTPLNPGTPSITGVAYTNVDNDPATGTALYDIDFATDTLFLQNPPNNGTLVAVGSLGVDFDQKAGFDIFTPSTGVNTAFAASRSTLYNINLSTGAATSVGAIGSGSDIVGLTATVPEPSVTFGALLWFGILGLANRFRSQAKSST